MLSFFQIIFVHSKELSLSQLEKMTLFNTRKEMLRLNRWTFFMTLLCPLSGVKETYLNLGILK
jgi:hypothetical protein